MSAECVDDSTSSACMGTVSAECVDGSTSSDCMGNLEYNSNISVCNICEGGVKKSHAPNHEHKNFYWMMLL